MAASATVCCVAIHALREHELRKTRGHGLRVVVMSLANYQDVFGRVPRAIICDESGKPLYSWRMALLPFSPVAPTGPEDRQALYAGDDYHLDRSWDDVSNVNVTNRPIWLYCFAGSKAGHRIETNVFVVTGPGTAFEHGMAHRLAELPPDTIILIEVARSGIPWAAPGDLDIRNVPASITRGLDGKGVHVVFADQSVWYLRKDVPLDVLRTFFTIEGARRFDRERLLGPYAQYRLP